MTHAAGSFCTAVLLTNNLERAESFYSTLVGWKFQNVTGASGHRLAQVDGRTVANVQEVPSNSGNIWVPHVLVENLERTTADAVALGAAPVHRIDIPHVARIAALLDTEGAMFGLWESALLTGAEIMEGIGALWWIEVLSNNVAGAREFYQRLFGWATVDTSFEPFPSYTVFKRGDVQEGGILPIGPDWEVPPRWNSIFAVPDCDATLNRACELGGSNVFVHTVPKHGRIGIVNDPGGAVLVLRGPVPQELQPGLARP